MAAVKFLVCSVLLVVLATQSEIGLAQNCSAAIGGLMSCGPYVLPGNQLTPSTQCCSAIQAVNHGCLCETINIISSLPGHCSLPPVSCGTA
uniref:Protein LIM3 n=1 Tax=Lilium longiflorum TaxID=4690 RepID=LIM3_LILLO|nr:RecName: Full=Protein LIM3; Flags: Precursor [Lilium longiflorum]